MPCLHIRLFGQFSVCCGDEALQDLIPGKAQELFCYLLTHRGRPIGREFLASVLWSDCTTERSKQYFRKALWQLHSSLDNASKLGEQVLQIDAKNVAVRSDADLWLDVSQFERECSGKESSSWYTDGSCVKALETAINLYRGDLLEGWYQDWCLYERERLQNTYLTMLDKMVAYSEMHREYEKGIDYSTRILRCDRANESAHRHLMRLRYLSGDRSGALRQYESCAAALKEELGVQPSERTRELYGHICEDHISMNRGPQSDCPDSDGGPSLLQEVLNHLGQAKEALAVLQNVVEESVVRIDQAIRSSGRSTFPPKKDHS